MDVNKVVKVCAFSLLNFFKNTVMQFGIAKIFLLLGRFRKPSAFQLSREDTYREMAASNEDWSGWDAVIDDGLNGDGMKAKIEKFAGISDENLSTEQIMSLTRD